MFPQTSDLRNVVTFSRKAVDCQVSWSTFIIPAVASLTYHKKITEAEDDDH